jgi:hypothetical protein
MTDPARMPQFEEIVRELSRCHPRVPGEDIRQEAKCVILHPDFGGNWAYFRSKLNFFIRKFEQFSKVLRQVNLDSSGIVLVKPRPLSACVRMTVGQRGRIRRDMVIQIAASAGVSQRILAEVFDLPRSRIGVIVATDLQAKIGNRT